VKASRKKRKALQSNGAKVIHFLQDVLGEEKFFFDFGTLLGIVRENGIIGHDLDIDLGIMLNGDKEIERIRNLLAQNGCKLVYTFSINEIGTVEDSFIINDIKFDIAYYHREKDADIVYLMYRIEKNALEDNTMNVVKAICSPIDEIERINFKGKMINVPKNRINYLVERYGETWTIPDKNYVYWKGPSVEPTNYKGQVKKYI
jgi:phosphorylcholine metabolism protein LicD